MYFDFCNSKFLDAWSVLLRVGVVGLGKMGKLHFQNALRMKDVKLVAVADKIRANRKVAEKHNVKAYEDYTQLIDLEELDAVIISLPNFLREESITYATEKNLDIFVDKPLARNVAEATRILGKVRKRGVRLMTGVNYRYIESLQKLKTLVDDGRIGDIVIATSDLIMNGPFSHSLDPKPVPEWWFSGKEAGGGALLDLGYHLIDIMNWTLGDLQTEYSNLGYRYQLPVEDEATLVLSSKKSRTKCTINVGWFSKSIPPEFNFRVNFHGTVGFASTDNYAPRNLYIHAVKEATRNLMRKILGMKINYLSYTYYYTSFYKILELFVESIKRDTEIPVSTEEQLEVVNIIEDVYRRHGVT